MSLQRPNITERVELELPIKFVLKDEYGTLEVMNIIVDRDGRPDIDDMIDDNGDEDGEDEVDCSPIMG